MGARDRYEEGSALLIVFVFAAIVGIMLYRALPSVVFEAQRQKEQLLIDRASEYKLAIRRFYAKNSRYPTAMEQLDKFNNVRYLRRHYKDPMTGKEEWRLIHIQGPGFVLTDSKVTPLKANQQNANSSFGSSNGGGFGNSQNTSQTPPQNSGGFGSNSSETSNQETANNNTSNNGNNGNPPEPSAAQLYGAQRRPPPVRQESAIPQAQQQAAQGELEPPSADPTGTEPTDEAPPPSPQPAGNGGTQAAANPGPTAPGAVAGMPVTDPNIANANNPNSTNSADAALNSVSSSLRRPGTVPTQNRPQQQPAGPTILNGSIAGVASTASGSSIKSIEKQTDYSKWEFVFNPQKDAVAGMQGAMNNMSNNGQNGKNNANTTSNNSGGFGTPTSTGVNSSTTPNN